MTDELIETLTTLKYSTRFNSDENVALEEAVKELKKLALGLDGIFFRFDSNTDIVRSVQFDLSISVPKILPEPVGTANGKEKVR